MEELKPPQNIYLIVNRCLGCEECIEACTRENGRSLCFVDSFKGVPVPFRCSHCEDAVCEKVCPTEAIHIKDDVVLVRAEECIGCRFCELVCPWGAPIYDEETSKIVKCDMCYNRQLQGDVPACVELCPSKALVFGKSSEFQEDYHKSTAERLDELGAYARKTVLPQEG